MGFMSLSHAAHRMEDFLKILRVRLDPSAIDTQVETWLLQGVDGLRAITSRLDRGLDIDDTWLTEQVYPAFEHLRDRFGDLQESEEDALLAQAENVDVSLVIFEGGVDDCLTQFEPQIDTLDSNQLRDELASTAEQLAEFGRMCELDAFVSLCVSVQQQLAEASPATVQPLARRALQEWQRCHSLV
ncbi:MAG: hybrid sensor histidine kinase/response regulator, partial [Cyanobacteria bacterium J06639_1]